MTCSQCGTLNPDDIERCTRCGHAMSGAEDRCVNHPDVAAVTKCSLCDDPLCDECDVLVAGSPYCPKHAEAFTSAPPDVSLETARIFDPNERAAATFGERVEAGVIDLGLVLVGSFILFLLMWAFLSVPPTHYEAGGWRTIYWVVVVVGAWAYFAASNAGGQTLGKSAADIIVLREDGSLPGVPVSAARAVLAWIGFFALGFGFWPILWRPDRRALHDTLLKTVVFQENP